MTTVFARIVVCFFFQAEDGIRDHCVTGVQTCALPIWPRRCYAAAVLRVAPPAVTDDPQIRAAIGELRQARDPELVRLLDGEDPVARYGLGTERELKIGRASCRERVEDTGGAGYIKKRT